MKRFIQSLLKKRDYRLVEESAWQETEDLLDASAEILTEKPSPLDSWPEVIVFSKDRPLQLHGLLRSLEKHSGYPYRVHVLYSSEPESSGAYDQVLGESYDLELYGLRESESLRFKQGLVTLLERVSSEFLFFLVDDIVFTAEPPVKAWMEEGLDMSRYIPSLRLGRNITQSYMTHGAVEQPDFDKSRSDYIVWDWKDGVRGWAYPHSVDGNIFLTREILAYSRILNFKSPNTYERALGRLKFLFFKRKGIAPNQSCLVNIPCNKVQTDNNNEAGDLSPGELLAYWNQGKRLDIEEMEGFVPDAFHMDIPLPMKGEEK